MSHVAIAPQLVANLLIVAFFAVEALRRYRRRAPAPAPAANRGTTPVFWGCYLIALIALNTTIPSPVTFGPEIAWLGAASATAGLGAWIANAAPRHTGRLGKLVLWVGAATASGNVIAALSVGVAMLAATGVSASESNKDRGLGGRQGA